jgi:hypothetical protein
MTHVPDDRLVQALDGELSAREASAVAEHLKECWTCRARKQQLETAIADFVRLSKAELPPAEGPRALLKAQIHELASAGAPSGNWWPAVAMCCALLIGGLMIGELWRQNSGVVVSVPNPRLTPGATVLMSAGEVCNAAGEKNKAVPVALRRQVFEAYGIRHPGARAYEVDYLITPALGGADDIRNLWPQSYGDTAWNARVKDQLEDHLRELVCEGRLDLGTAQREIAGNWIDAYKKYFHTDRPR